MIQRHSIILWKKAEKKDKDFAEFAKETYEVLNIFQDYPEELKPNYLTAKTKESVKKIDWNYENFSKLLKNGIAKEGGSIFEELGYSISFFSSMCKQDSCAFEILTGNKNEKFYNTLIIKLPLSMDFCKKDTANIIRILFEKLVQSYMPYWGCVTNKVLSRKYGKFLDGKVPTTVHWMNYWSLDIIRALGLKKIQNIVSENPSVSFESGILSIKETALDVEKKDDIIFHNGLQKQLFL